MGLTHKVSKFSAKINLGFTRKYITHLRIWVTLVSYQKRPLRNLKLSASPGIGADCRANGVLRNTLCLKYRTTVDVPLSYFTHSDSHQLFLTSWRRHRLVLTLTASLTWLLLTYRRDSTRFQSRNCSTLKIQRKNGIQHKSQRTRSWATNLTTFSWLSLESSLTSLVIFLLNCDLLGSNKIRLMAYDRPSTLFRT